MRVAIVAFALPWLFGPYAHQTALLAQGLMERGGLDLFYISLIREDLEDRIYTPAELGVDMRKGIGSTGHLSDKHRIDGHNIFPGLEDITFIGGAKEGHRQV